MATGPLHSYSVDYRPVNRRFQIRAYGREGAINPHTERNSQVASRNDRPPSPAQTDRRVNVPIQERGSKMEELKGLLQAFLNSRLSS